MAFDRPCQGIAFVRILYTFATQKSTQKKRFIVNLSQLLYILTKFSSITSVINIQCTRLQKTIIFTRALRNICNKIPLHHTKQSLRGSREHRLTWQSRGSSIVARALSSRSPRHLTCTPTWLLFQYM